MKRKQIEVGVIPAGGKGTRLGWLGKLLPKSLVPIGQKPMIFYVVRNLKKMGVKTVIVLVNYQKAKIQNYLKDEPEFKKIRFKFKHSEQNLGLADVIYKTKEIIKDQFIVVLGDDFTICDRLSEFPQNLKQKNAVLMEAVIKEKSLKTLSQTCEVFLKKGNYITKAIEKPKKPKPGYRGCGIYLFSSEIFESIAKTPISKSTRKKEITDTINLLAKKGKATAWKLDGININVNTIEDLIAATSTLYKQK